MCVCNVHTVMSSAEDPALRAALYASSINVPDGQPLVWAVNALGYPLPKRVYGPELMDRACARAAANGQRFYLYGGRDQGALFQLALSLRQRHPGIRIVGGYSPPHRPLTDQERAAPGGGDQRLPPRRGVGGHRRPQAGEVDGGDAARLEAPVLVGVGAAFDFHAGLVPQAPNWLQDAGLEWAYRLAHEPRRLWRRYLRYNPRFVAAFARQLAEQDAAGPSADPGARRTPRR